MWALCRSAHGITWPEFQELSLAQIEALEERRTIAVRHERFNAALVASTLININRPADTEAVSPFDFLAGYDRDPEEEERLKLRKSVKQAVALAFTEMKGVPAEVIQAEKAAMIGRMRDSGIDDPEELIREVFPEL